MTSPKHILLIDIDGLRPDVFQHALERDEIPNIARILGGRNGVHGLQIPIVSNAPSITFCCQASLFTGAHPKEHGVPGNQFFDRFGTDGKHPDFYAFDVGDTLEADDAVKVFTHGLASQRLQVPTFYEEMEEIGKHSVVVSNMYGQGAKWIPPSLVHLGRFLKGKNIFGMNSAEFDRATLNNTLQEIDENGLPDVLTVYFMGVDHDSHKYGPSAQPQALQVIDQLIGELWDTILKSARGSVFTSIFSDHGQIEMIDDDQHSLRLGFPFDRELASFFDELQLDVHDYPGEAPECDAVLALNGGTANVYLHNKEGHWRDRPDFERDVLPIGRAFWGAHQTGLYSADLKGAIAGVLVRNVEKEGWEAPYQALTPQGTLVSLETWFQQQPQGLYLDAVNRLNNYTGRFCGDIFLISNYADQYYFGGELKGIHGGLHPDDSRATLAYGWFGVSVPEWQDAKERIKEAIAARCTAENGREPNLVDMLTGVKAIL